MYFKLLYVATKLFFTEQVMVLAMEAMECLVVTVCMVAMASV